MKENKIKVFGFCLILLGIFTGVCLMISVHLVDTPTLEVSYKMGMLAGTAVAECTIGSLLNFFFN